MRISKKSLFVSIAIVLTVALSSAAFAQEDDVAAKLAGDKNDKTGTNPINFQDDIRIYSEYSWLNTDGDGAQTLTTLEYRTPFAGGKWQYRMRLNHKYYSIDDNDDGVDEINSTGIGDFDFRFLTIFSLKGKNGFAGAMEVFLNSANKEELGSGTTTLAPQVFYARFFTGGFGPYRGGLFAPGLQWRHSVQEDPGRTKTRQIAVDLNFLMMGKSKKHWFFANPQIIRDTERNTESAVIDIEFGLMLKWKGQSAYIRPAFGVGGDRPTDYGLEFGYKFVGFGS